MEPGISGGLVERMPPPVSFANRHMWYGPVGVGIASPNDQPSTRSAQARVAGGSVLASSVCVITPMRDGGATGRGAARRAGALGASFLPADFLRGAAAR